MSVNEKMTAIADNIRDKTGGTERLTLDGMAESIPKVYSAGQSSMVDESKLIPKTVSGSYISVDDVSEIPHSVGCKVESVNLLFNKQGNLSHNTTYKQVEWTVNEDGTINVVGTCTADDNSDYYFFGSNVDNDDAFVTEEDMVIKSNSYDNEVVCALRLDSGYKQVTNLEHDSVVIPAGTKIYGVFLRIHNKTVDAQNIWVTLNRGTTALPYTPYVKPEEVTVTRTGVNLYEPTIDSITKNGVTITRNADNSYTVKGTATADAIFHIGNTLPVEPGVMHYMSGGTEKAEVGFQLRKGSTGLNTKISTGTVETVYDTECDRINVVIIVRLGTTVDDVVKPMISLFNTSTYEPYNGQTLTPATDGTVEGMTSVSPYMNIFTDTDGVNIEADYNKSYGYDEAVTRFWNEYTLNNTKGNYGYAFAGSSWTEKLLKSIPFPLYIWGAPGLFCYNSVVTDLSDFPIQGGALKITNCGQLIRSAKSLKKMFCIDGTDTTTFYAIAEEATALESISFVANTVKVSIDLKACPLNKDSIISTVEGLSPTVTGQTLTLKLSAVNTAFETSTDAADGSTSEEFAALVATKTNWTITMI